MSPASKLPDYVFRGTTINYHGNDNAIKFPYTCTSFHPVKALWFALECFHRNPEIAVIYIAKTEKLAAFKPVYNVLKKVENEIGLIIPPLKFYPYCEGYIHVIEMQKLLSANGIEAHNVAKTENLTRLCRETQPLGAKKIITLVELMLKHS